MYIYIYSHNRRWASERQRSLAVCTWRHFRLGTFSIIVVLPSWISRVLIFCLDWTCWSDISAVLICIKMRWYCGMPQTGYFTTCLSCRNMYLNQTLSIYIYTYWARERIERTRDKLWWVTFVVLESYCVWICLETYFIMISFVSYTCHVSNSVPMSMIGNPRSRTYGQ
jgi:hypothetical protein